MDGAPRRAHHSKSFTVSKHWSGSPHKYTYFVVISFFISTAESRRQPTTTHSDGNWVPTLRKERDRRITRAIAIYEHGRPGVRLEAAGQTEGCTRRRDLYV